MATLNDRINDMLSRLEAAAASAMDDSGQSRPKQAQQQSRYSYQPQPEQQQQQQPEPGPGSFARSLEEAARKEQASMRSASASVAQPYGTIPPISAHTMVQGVIYAEILGRPVARRKGRGRKGF